MATTTAAIYYLTKLDAYKQVKPYMFAYDLPPGIGPNTNHVYEPHDVTISDEQGNLNMFSLDVHGFAFADWKTELTSVDFDNPAMIQDKYEPEVLRYLEKMSPPGCELHVLNHSIRKRGPHFPETHEKAAEGVQNPIIFAHVDYSEMGAKVAMRTVLQAYPHLQGRKFDIVNVWRPTKGPIKHWPLALCDYRSVDRADIETNDVIHEDHVGESVRLYGNPQHRWHYLDNQTTDQVAIFRSATMNDETVPFGAHSSFARSQEDKTPSARRESIGVRVIRYFA